MTVPGAVKDPLILTHFRLCQVSHRGEGTSLIRDTSSIVQSAGFVLTPVKEWVWGGGDGI